MVRRDTGPAEADVALAPSGALEVRAATTPAASPFLLFAVPSDRRGIPRIVRMFPGRSAFLRALEPGAWDVQLADGSSRPRERRRIEIVAGETRLVELPLP